MKTIREIFNHLATAYRIYPLKNIEDTKEIGQALSDIKALLKEKMPKDIFLSITRVNKVIDEL